MTWSQPCSRASSPFSALPAVPMTVAPSALHHWLEDGAHPARGRVHEHGFARAQTVGAAAEVPGRHPLEHRRRRGLEIDPVRDGAHPSRTSTVSPSLSRSQRYQASSPSAAAAESTPSGPQLAHRHHPPLAPASPSARSRRPVRTRMRHLAVAGLEGRPCCGAIVALLRPASTRLSVPAEAAEFPEGPPSPHPCEYHRPRSQPRPPSRYGRTPCRQRWHRVEPAPVVGVDEVQPDGLVPDEHLAGSRVGYLDVDGHAR